MNKIRIKFNLPEGDVRFEDMARLPHQGEFVLLTHVLCRVDRVIHLPLGNSVEVVCDCSVGFT